MIEIKVDEDVLDLKCDKCWKKDRRKGVKETIAVDWKEVDKYYCENCVKTMSLFKAK